MTKVAQDDNVPRDNKRHEVDEEADAFPKEISQSQRDRNKKTKRFVLGFVLLLATILILVGLAVGLTQRNKDTSTGTPPTTFGTSNQSHLPRPVILDEDYGAFPDDIFSLALALELKDIMDVKAVVATSMDPFASALCMAQHLSIAGHPEIPVFVGKDIHEAPFRAGIWIPEDLVGFPLREKCESVLQQDSKRDVMRFHDMKDLAYMLKDSDHDDWVYLALGGMTTVAALTQEYPEAAAKIKDMVVMGANVCGEKEIYEKVYAPVQETNAAVSFVMHITLESQGTLLRRLLYHSGV